MKLQENGMESSPQALIQQAKQHYSSGDRDAAYGLLSKAIQLDPNNITAWLWMSGLVDTAEKKRYCLERVLAIDPENEAARRGLNMLRVQAVAQQVKELPPDQQIPVSDRQAGKVGDYLVERGVITRKQLEMALDEQRLYWQKWQGVRPPLGDILISHGLLTPESLASALADQQYDRLYGKDRKTPQYLGEYLVEQGVITNEQFKSVLEKQTRMRQRGTSMLIGELLISAGYITPETLEKVLEAQQEEMFKRFGFDDEF